MAIWRSSPIIKLSMNISDYKRYRHPNIEQNVQTAQHREAPGPSMLPAP